MCWWGGESTSIVPVWNAFLLDSRVNLTVDRYINEKGVPNRGVLWTLRKEWCKEQYWTYKEENRGRIPAEHIAQKRDYRRLFPGQEVMDERSRRNVNVDIPAAIRQAAESVRNQLESGAPNALNGAHVPVNGLKPGFGLPRIR